jgi:NADPH:quinone reductase-like Zn-dependent oxidoreductase
MFGRKRDSLYYLLGKSAARVLKAGKYGGIVGNDFAGTVVELGPDVSAGVRTVGERVGWFQNPRQSVIFQVVTVVFSSEFGFQLVSANGTFAEYVVAESEYGDRSKVPEHLDVRGSGPARHSSIHRLAMPTRNS